MSGTNEIDVKEYVNANVHYPRRMTVPEVLAAEELSDTETALLDGALAGTVVASKAAVYDAAGKLLRASASPAAAGANQGNATAMTAELNAVTGADGAKGVKLPAAAADTIVVVINTDATNSLLVYPATDDQINALGANNAFTITPGQRAEFIGRSASLWYTAAATDTVTGLTSSATELNYNDIAALGTGAASKAVVLDAGEDFVWPDTGILTIGVLATASEAAEHGAGAIGTAATPTTKRWIERGGIIVTQTTFDLTGLASGGTANDVVGLAAGGAAYIGRNVVATNGVIFKMELSCLETPATGDGDIDIVADTSAALIGDGAYTGAIKINGGTLVVGQTVQNLVPAVNANFYFYIAAVGAGGGTYTAGMFVLTTYGHAVLA